MWMPVRRLRGATYSRSSLMKREPQIMSSELGRGFTVIQDSDGDDFSLGILQPPQRPTHPYQVRGSDRFAECLRVLLGLGGVVLYCLAERRFADAIPALLGVIACALAETEDHWRNRLGTLLVTLACFAVAAFAVEQLLPYPPLFA